MSAGYNTNGITTILRCTHMLLQLLYELPQLVLSVLEGGVHASDHLLLGTLTHLLLELAARLHHLLYVFLLE